MTTDAIYRIVPAAMDTARARLRAARVPFRVSGNLLTVARCFARHSDRELGKDKRVSS